jgi:hypothetical protein
MVCMPPYRWTDSGQKPRRRHGGEQAELNTSTRKNSMLYL